MKGTSTYTGSFPFDLLGSPPCAVRLEIGIVGAGIAGLSAAIALRKVGHRVEIFERSRFKNEVGAAINVCPNASRVLNSYGFDFGRVGAVVVEQSNFLDGETLQTKVCGNYTETAEKYGSPWYFLHRADLHGELRRLAVQKDAVTEPVRINLGTEVAESDVDAGVLILADGTIIRKDLIVAADGVHSSLVSKVIGRENPAKFTGISAFRFLIPTEKLLADPETRPFFENQPAALRIWNLRDGRKFVAYPCRSGQMQNCLILHPSDLGKSKREEWNKTGSFGDLLRHSKGFHPMIQKVIGKAGDVKIWPLLYRPPISTWVKGSVVLIGDAAHPMLPYQGQGGGQAIEDGASLGVLLSQLSDVRELPARLKLFVEIRKTRAPAIQIFSNAAQDEADTVQEEAKKYVKGLVPRTMLEFWDWNFSYDTIDSCLQALGLEFN